LAIGALPLPAQSFRDSLQAYAAAVRDFSTPNGRLTELSRQKACLPRLDCKPETHSLALVSALTKALGLSVASDARDAQPACPWATAAGSGTGVVAEVGGLRFSGANATVHVVRRCTAARGFQESTEVELRRRNGG
jgi:hypothetical protein